MGKKQIKLEKKVERRKRVKKEILARRAALRAEAKEKRKQELLEKNIAKLDAIAQQQAKLNYSPELQKLLETLEEMKKDKNSTEPCVLPNQTTTIKNNSKEVDSSEDEIL